MLLVKGSYGMSESAQDIGRLMVKNLRNSDCPDHTEASMKLGAHILTFIPELKESLGGAIKESFLAFKSAYRDIGGAGTIDPNELTYVSKFASIVEVMELSSIFLQEEA